MKYEQPYGITDPNAPYINGNPAAGIQGSIPPAAAFEFPMRELVALIAAGGQTPSDSDLQQLLRSVRGQLINYCVDQGTLANNYTAAFNPPLIAYTNGMPFRLRVANTNTGISSFDAGPGRHPVKRYGGADPAAGDIPAGSIAELVWNTDHFELMNFAGVSTGGGGPPPVVVPGLVNVQVFMISATYTPTTGAQKALVFVTGGGAGGAVNCAPSPGGGAGATAIALVPLSGVPSVVVTIGAGGAPQPSNNTLNGNPGSPSSFGTYGIAGGGLGGTITQVQGGRGGTASAGLLLIAGGDGFSVGAISGAGGASFWGGGSAGMINGVQPPNAQAFGAGGAGTHPAGTGLPSAAGRSGVCLVLEF
ncbi:MAG TPA: hypothetical protein VGH47_00775 [Xanthobacteraceae bacterium]|jgi:hypothetical protein